MRLKRVYKNGEHVGTRILRADKPLMHFSPAFLDLAYQQALASVAGGHITFESHGGKPVKYRAVRTPGIYCCYCDARLGDCGEGGNGGSTRFLEHVAKCGGGKPSPDPNNPAGYRQENWHTAALVSDPVNLMSEVEAIALEKRIRTGRWSKVGPKHRAKSLLLSGGADFVFNIGKGRATQLYDNIDTNNPANSAFIIVIIDANGDTDATMKDRDDISALLGGLANEVTNANYARKTLTDVDLTAWAPDDVNDRVDLDIPDQTWTAVGAGTSWTDFIVAYDNDTTAGTDANVTPLTLHDFAVTPDGSDITAQIATAGFFRAS